MKKIMFNDKYGLTAAVLNGSKTQTRRIINAMPQDPKIAYGLEEKAGYVHLLDGYTIVAESKYKIGEVVAVAQSYFDIKTSANSYRPPIWEGYKDWHKYLDTLPPYGAGYYNKMFVKPGLMPHRIRIEKVRVERLQDISEVDCIREGVFDLEPYEIRPKFTVSNLGEVFITEKEAYAALIDAISGKGTWESNPWVFVYNFKLIK